MYMFSWLTLNPKHFKRVAVSGAAPQGETAVVRRGAVGFRVTRLLCV